MRSRFWLCVLGLFCVQVLGAADTIVIEGVVHSGVKIYKSPSRYYVKLPNGTTLSVAKADVKPWEIAFGEDPLPKPPSEPAPQAAVAPVAEMPASVPDRGDAEAAAAMRAEADRAAALKRKAEAAIAEMQAEAQRKLEAIEAAAKRAAEERASAEQDAAASRAAAAQAASEKAEAERTIAEMRAAAAQAEADRAEAERQLAELKAAAARAAEERAAAERQAAELRTEQQQAAVERQAAQTTAAEMRAAAEALAGERARAEAALAELKASAEVAEAKARNERAAAEEAARQREAAEAAAVEALAEQQRLAAAETARMREAAEMAERAKAEAESERQRLAALEAERKREAEEQAARAAAEAKAAEEKLAAARAEEERMKVAAVATPALPSAAPAQRRTARWELIEVAVARAPLRAGAARIVIDDVPEWSRRLEINALVLEAGGPPAAFVSVDTAAVGLTLTDEIQRRLAAAGSRVNADGLIVAATGAPTGRFDGALDDPLSGPTAGVPEPGVFGEAAELTARAVMQAEKRLTPARVRIAEAEAPDFQDTRAGGGLSTDATLGVIAVEDEKGGPLAVLVNYALHPPVPPSTPPTGERGAPGALARVLREQARAEIPVLFFNGAAGDTVLVAPESAPADTPSAALGAALARLAIEALESAELRGEVVLSSVHRRAPLPVSLLEEGSPREAVLHEVRLDNVLLLAAPGLPAAQLGLLLRVGGILRGAEQVFLFTLAGASTGVAPSIEEYFAVTPETVLAPLGAAMVRWYAGHAVLARYSDGALAPDPAAQPLWHDVPALGRYATGFEFAVDRGRTDEPAVADACARLRAWLAGHADAMFRSNSADAALWESIPEARRPGLAPFLAARTLRRGAAGLTEEQRALLLGIAEGAGAPFDALVLLQAAALNPDAFPDGIPAQDFLRR